MLSSSFCVRAAALVVALSAVAGVSVTRQQGVDLSPTPLELARIWDAEHVSPPVSPLVDHAEVVRRLDALVVAAPDLFQVETLGESVQGRSINHVRIGAGPTGILLWSQMHGDEPTATSALFDLFEYLRRHRETPTVQRLLTELTLHVVPMLNPDGAERFQRRNAQGLDINRDALRLQTPEGRLLKSLRDRLNPRVGFNLHDQSWRTSVGRPPRPASISLLAVASDEQRSVNAGRLLTKQICAVIREALEPFASGQIGRYDDQFEVRAFGDNITLWGTPVVLIETGPWPSDRPDPALVRLNFIALVAALDALASGQVDRANPGRYDTLPLNESRMFHVVVRGATVIIGDGVAPFVADIGIGATRRVHLIDQRRELRVALTIEDLGDLHTHGALRTIEAAGLTAVPLLSDSLEAGQIVDLPDWRVRSAVQIAVGQAARLAILRPAADPGTFVVEAVLR